MNIHHHGAASGPAGSAGEVFAVFLKLGLTSFGGPIAHLGYFRDELVLRRKWLGEAEFADLVALCQFLPGPASSQVGFALGLLRGGGLLGGLAAWLAFTLPSALILLGFAFGAASLSGPVTDAMLHGLKLVAVAVVGQAVWGMARTLTPDRQRVAIAFAAICLTVFPGGAAGQVGAILMGALAGLLLCRDTHGAPPIASGVPISRRGGLIALGLFAVLFALLPIWAGMRDSQLLALFGAFYRAGALVFGGGHVVLPLLQAELVPRGWIDGEAFLAGYGVAQAVPGPLFTFAAYLGAVMDTRPDGIGGAIIALAAIFLPGMLLVYGTLPFWSALKAQPLAQAGIGGANAAVVGILGAALHDPVWTGSVMSSADFVLALAGFLLLAVWRAQPWMVVLLLAGGSALLSCLQP